MNQYVDKTSDFIYYGYRKEKYGDGIMSKISFISLCIEKYTKHTGKTSDEVYKIFKRDNILDLLDHDYDDLHGMGEEYLMQFIDECLGHEADKHSFENKINDHSTVRALIVPEVVKLISEKYDVNERDAMDKFYTSAAGESFADDETGLYGQSALFVFGLFCEEFKEGIK